MRMSNPVKPFVKWAGGKGQLLPVIASYYPFERSGIRKYVEPFVGGGAVLFDILNKHDLDEVYISDINADLITAYCVVRDSVEDLIEMLLAIQQEFLPMPTEERKACYLEKRERFNFLKISNADWAAIEKAALMIFLNKTCFNGLYRVNKKGLFNVPMGIYKSPTICDEKNLRNISEKLKVVTIHCGDYQDSLDFIDEKTFVYIDPPYRPISVTANFTSYTDVTFDDDAQIALAQFAGQLDRRGAQFVISNSDPTNHNDYDRFFDDMYSSYTIRRVEATRMINCDSKSRGKIRELIISNF